MSVPEHVVTAAASELGAREPHVPLGELPNEPGLYAFWPKDAGVTAALGLEDVPGAVPLGERVLYIGKAEDSLMSRVGSTHLADGKTGNSTVRRTLAALLDMDSCPRHNNISSPTHGQLLDLTSHYGLEGAEEGRLTEWMTENLVIRVAPSDWTPLEDLERAVGAVLCPPLDQAKKPLWGPNPWRQPVSCARERLRLRARRKAGLE